MNDPLGAVKMTKEHFLEKIFPQIPDKISVESGFINVLMDGGLSLDYETIQIHFPAKKTISI